MTTNNSLNTLIERLVADKLANGLETIIANAINSQIEKTIASMFSSASVETPAESPVIEAAAPMVEVEPAVDVAPELKTGESIVGTTRKGCAAGENLVAIRKINTNGDYYYLALTPAGRRRVSHSDVKMDKAPKPEKANFVPSKIGTGWDYPMVVTTFAPGTKAVKTASGQWLIDTVIDGYHCRRFVSPDDVNRASGVSSIGKLNKSLKSEYRMSKAQRRAYDHEIGRCLCNATTGHKCPAAKKI